MLTSEGPPRTVGDFEERETVNFSFGSTLRSSTKPISTNFGPDSPGWNVTSLTAPSKSWLPALSVWGVMLKCIYRLA